MSEQLANDVRNVYDKAFATVRGIIEAFPDDKWLVPHGDDYYIPSRIAYHLAVFIDGAIGGGFRKDPDFRSKAPYGAWHEGTPETLPDRKSLLKYYDEAVGRAKEELAPLDDNAVTAMNPPEMARMGASKIGSHM